MNDASRRLQEFDILRTVSILLLMAHHSGFYSLTVFGVSLKGLSPFVEAFLLGCFFLISGYFTAVSLQRTNGNLTDFFKSRFIRIYLPYLPAFGLYVLVLDYSFNGKFDILVYLTGTQFIFSPSVVKPVLTLWYVSAILVYYAAFVFLWKLMPKTVTFLAIAILIFIFAYALHLSTGLMDERFYKYYFVFLTGMLLARQSKFEGILSAQWMLSKVALTVLGILVFSFTVKAGEAPISLLYVAASYIFIVPAVILLFCFAAKFSRHSPWMWVSGISYASYFVYLFHRSFWKIIEDAFPVQGLQNQILFRVMPASLAVLIICYFLQRFYDFSLEAVKEKSQRLKSTV